jgi:hypothetical protein
MARPKPNILLTIELGDGSTWDVMHSESHYIITYQGQPCGVRQHNVMHSDTAFRYQKLSYTNLGNAQAQARRLNNKLQTEDFDVRQIS